jgi:hypothetical protein
LSSDKDSKDSAVKYYLDLESGRINAAVSHVKLGLSPEEFLTTEKLGGAFLTWVVVELDEAPEEEQQA